MEFDYVPINIAFIAIYFIAIMKISYDILTQGLLFLSDDTDGYFVQLVWLGMFLWLLTLLPANWKILKNIIRSRGRTLYPPAEIVEGLNAGPRTVELTESRIELSMSLEQEFIDWRAITDVYDDSGTYRLSSGFNYVLSLPKTDDITAFLKARGYDV